ncbi:MAG: glycoside hydrolase family 125 protein [Anaerolineae bacterium]|nr:glycoside hydrolase family 125 protein [Anaerolineae bacterium]
MKPLDFGGGGVTGSVNTDGRITALNFYHPTHGYVTLTSAEPFDESQRYNAAAVRAYRASLTAQDGFGLRLAAPVSDCQISLHESAIPEITLQTADGQATVTTFAVARGAVQVIDAPAGTRWAGRLCLQRCAYTQLTEGGPLPMPPLQLRVYPHDDLLVIHNPALGAAVAVAGLDVSSSPVHEADHLLDIDLPLSSERLAYGVGLTVEQAVANAHQLKLRPSLMQVEDFWRDALRAVPDDPLVRRGIVYAVENAVPWGNSTCFLTDHMLLPLSWNRDAYYAARALLSAGQAELVRRHLIWMFETAERPDGAWARCYLANGHVKDSAFQLDQQLYPLLELTDYVLTTNDQAIRMRFAPQVAAVLAMLDTRRSPDALLFPTDETPADDPIPLPYHLSSHILLWHTLKRLDTLGLAGAWAARLSDLRDSIQRAFVSDYNGERIYAYAADGEGHYHFYHDANDFPLALAPAWGFCPADDPVWRSTVDFAFSNANHSGFYDGHLGSVHSPAPWALGDVQDLIVARALGDNSREARARAALRFAAQGDGALPEAYNAGGGSVYSRHWFVWTNAALACVELGAFES